MTPKVIGIPNVICSQCRQLVATGDTSSDDKHCERCGLTLQQVYDSISDGCDGKAH